MPNTFVSSVFPSGFEKPGQESVWRGALVSFLWRYSRPVQQEDKEVGSGFEGKQLLWDIFNGRMVQGKKDNLSLGKHCSPKHDQFHIAAFSETPYKHSCRPMLRLT